MAVEIPIQFPGVDLSEAQLRALLGTLVSLASAEQQNTAANEQLTRSTTENTRATNEQQRATTASNQAQIAASTSAIQFTQRIAGVANAVQSLVSQLGVGGHSAGLIGAMANSTAQFAQLGAAVGPEGALVGGIIGALIPAITSLITEQNDAATAARNHRTELEHLAQTAQSARADASRQRGISEGVFGRDTSDSQLATDTESRLTRIAELQRAIDTRRGQAQRTADTTGRTLDLRSELAPQHAEIEQLRHEIENIDAEVARRTQASQAHDTTLTTTEAPTPTPHRGGGTRRPFTYGVSSNDNEAADSGPQAAIVAQQAVTRELQAQREERDRLAEAAQRQTALELEGTKAELNAIHEKSEAEQEAANVRERLAREADDRNRAQARRTHEQFQQQAAGYQQVTGEIVGGITQAGIALASGAESAGDAFKHLLGSFLNMISQRAALSSAEQFALAIASFASEDYSGGALHAAAGVAFLGVAVAAGAGGAVLSAPSASGASAGAGGAPARPPSQSGSQGQQGGRTFNIYFDSPFVTAGTHAELFRGIRNGVSSSEARYPNG